MYLSYDIGIVKTRALYRWIANSEICSSVSKSSSKDPYTLSIEFFVKKIGGTIFSSTEVGHVKSFIKQCESWITHRMKYFFYLFLKCPPLCSSTSVCWSVFFNHATDKILFYIENPHTEWSLFYLFRKMSPLLFINYCVLKYLICFFT